MPKFMILGYGNPLRSDDGVGYQIARALLADRLSADVAVVAAQQLTPEMSQQISEVDRVLFIDAAQHGQPGTITVSAVSGAPSILDPHEISPALLLQLAHDLYGRAPRAHVMTVAAHSFETGDTLTEQVTAAIPGAILRVKEWIEREMKLGDAGSPSPG